MIPRTRRVRVAGVYSLGLYEFDAAYGFVSLEFAQRLLGKAAPDLIELRVANIDEAPAYLGPCGQRARQRLCEPGLGAT